MSRSLCPTTPSHGVRSLTMTLVAAVGAGLLSSCAGGPVESRTISADQARASAMGSVRQVRLVAAPATLALLDGRPLEVWAYNGHVPGPTLRVRLGETLRVEFTNQLPQPTTIHWHGVRVPNAMDGVPGVTQPPIEPGETFVYEFAPKDAGTFWFHPHVRSSEQVERGLFGVLIVEDPVPLPYSREVLWVLDDWRVTPEGAIDPRFNTRQDLAHDGRWGNVVTVNGQVTPRLDVRPGERIRLRMVNVANGRVFALNFAGLAPQVVAVDGLYTAHPLDLNGFEMAPGNRLDLDLVIPANALGQQMAVVDRFTRQRVPIAEILVTGEAMATPAFPSPARAQVPAWSSVREQLPARAEFALNARVGGPFGIQWTINDVAMDHTTHALPTPLQQLPRGELSWMRFVNDSYRLHPMHIHGLFFKVLARNGLAVDEPYMRDTVLVHAKETVDIAAVPEEPGRWMLHCHILEHAEAGMMTVLEVR